MSRLAENYAANRLSSTPHLECGIKVGDTVTWVNDYGVIWEHKVIGFSEPCSVGFIHFDSDSYWFPHKPDCITEVNGNKYDHTRPVCLLQR